MATQFYVYTHARPNTTDVHGIFYVGKGNGCRAFRLKNTKRSIYHQNIVNKYGEKNIIVRKLNCKDENHSFKMEVEIISILRRIGVTLANLTDGGEGPVGYKFTDEQLLKVRGRGSKHTPETILKLKDAQKLNWTKHNRREKQSIALKSHWANNENVAKQRSYLKTQEFKSKRSEIAKLYWRNIRDEKYKNQLDIFGDTIDD
jgi:hypothetical protein